MEQNNSNIPDDEIRKHLDSYYAFWFGINALYENWAKRYGLTINSLFALYIIRHHSAACTQRLICEKLQLPKQTVNAILESFAKSGCVTKEVLPSDRRNKRLLLTAKGKEYADEILTGLHRCEYNALNGMPARQRKNLVESSRIFFSRLTETLGENTKV